MWPQRNVDAIVDVAQLLHEKKQQKNLITFPNLIVLVKQKTEKCK